MEKYDFVLAGAISDLSAGFNRILARGLNRDAKMVSRTPSMMSAAQLQHIRDNYERLGEAALERHCKSLLAHIDAQASRIAELERWKSDAANEIVKPNALAPGMLSAERLAEIRRRAVGSVTVTDIESEWRCAEVDRQALLAHIDAQDKLLAAARNDGEVVRLTERLISVWANGDVRDDCLGLDDCKAAADLLTRLSASLREAEQNVKLMTAERDKHRGAYSNSLYRTEKAEARALAAEAQLAAVRRETLEMDHERDA